VLFQPIVSQTAVIVSISEIWSQPDRRRKIRDGLAVLLECQIRLAAGVVYIGRLRVQTKGHVVVRQQYEAVSPLDLAKDQLLKLSKSG
jgi:hypothetical protein